MSFPLKPAVQRLKIRKIKTRFDAMKGILIFLALLGRFGVWGIGTPKLLVLLVTKVHKAPRFRGIFVFLVEKEYFSLCFLRKTHILSKCFVCTAQNNSHQIVRVYKI